MGPLRQGPLPACLQFFQSVLANRFQHHEARFTLGWFDLPRQAFVHQGCHTVEQVQVEIGFSVAHSFSAFQCASAHEHR